MNENCSFFPIRFNFIKLLKNVLLFLVCQKNGKLVDGGEA